MTRLARLSLLGACWVCSRLGQSDNDHQCQVAVGASLNGAVR